MKYNLKKITLMFLIAICLFILPGSTSGKLISKSNDFISFSQIEELDYEDAKTYEEMLTFMYINLYSPEIYYRLKINMRIWLQSSIEILF